MTRPARPALVIAIAAMVLAACQPQRVARVDGRSIRADAGLKAQYDQDKAVCEGESQRAILAAARRPSQSEIDIVFRGCMAARGYVIRPAH
jgi:hypothetical protein